MGRAVHKWMIVGDVIISFTLPGSVHDDDWAPFVDAIKTKPVKKYLGTAIGEIEVTASQRKLIAAALKNRNIPTAAVTDEKLIRGIATAVSWLGVNIKAFAWVELRDALAHLKVAEPLASQIHDDVLKLKAEWTRR